MSHTTVNTSYLVGAIAMLCLLTIVTRILPMAAGRKLKDNRRLLQLGRQLPGCIMVFLVLYGMHTTKSNWVGMIAIELLALVIALLMHYWQRRFIVSLITGTSVFLILSHLFFQT